MGLRCRRNLEPGPATFADACWPAGAMTSPCRLGPSAKTCRLTPRWAKNAPRLSSRSPTLQGGWLSLRSGRPCRRPFGALLFAPSQTTLAASQQPWAQTPGAKPFERASCCSGAWTAGRQAVDSIGPWQAWPAKCRPCQHTLCRLSGGNGLTARAGSTGAAYLRQAAAGGSAERAGSRRLGGAELQCEWN